MFLRQVFCESKGALSVIEKTRIQEENDAEGNENADKETNDYNLHTETTASEFESLKLSTINHNESDYMQRVGGRLTRSAKLYTSHLNQQKTNALAVNNKRSRSPLAINNSINESTDQVNILTSTRIESTKMLKKKLAAHKPPKSSITIRPISVTVKQSNNNGSNDDDEEENEDNGGQVDHLDSDDQADLSDIESNQTELPLPKRKRRSDDNDVVIAVANGENNLPEATTLLSVS